MQLCIPFFLIYHLKINYMEKPKLGFWQIWNMSFGFLGIQFGFALQNGNVSRIFETLGADIADIPILWIAAPVTGLIIQPIIGHMSDHTWNRLGRRRPYFLTGAILSSLALLFMPYSPMLWMAAGMLWIMDASINITMEPFRAFVGDMLPEKQRTLGFAMQSFFIGIGAFVASWLPYIMTNYLGIANTAEPGIIPDSVKFSFLAGGVVFLLAVLLTIFKTKEYSPEELASFQEDTNTAASPSKLNPDSKQTVAELSLTSHKTESLTLLTNAEERNKEATIPVSMAPVYQRRSYWWGLGGLLFLALVYFKDYKAELYILGAGLSVFALLLFITSLLIRKHRSHFMLAQVIHDLNQMPKTMRQLAFIQFFSWFALFAMWIYTTSAVSSHIYHTSDPESALYNEAANWVSGMFGWYNLFAAGFAFLLPVLASKTSRRFTHAIALVAGGLSLASIFIISNPHHLIYPMIGIGLAWSSILSMPYAILTGSLPSHKMGVYMGIFNFFIVIPQILAASILGFMVQGIFQGHSIYALVLGGSSMLIAAFLSLFVQDTDIN